jgi:hypothetical protein
MKNISLLFAASQQRQLKNTIGSVKEPIFGDANHKNHVACAPCYCFFFRLPFGQHALTLQATAEDELFDQN